MEIVLPQTDGWSAVPLIDDEWAHSGLVVKRDYDVAGGVAVPSAASGEVLTGDALDGRDILRDGEMALFKAQTDWHYLGNPSGFATLTEAVMLVNGQERARFDNPVLAFTPDAHNLFGFEPRDRRVVLAVPEFDKDDLIAAKAAREIENAANGIVMTEVELADAVLADDFGYSFDFNAHIPAIFHSTRRSEGYSNPNAALPVPLEMDISFTGALDGGALELPSISLSRPDIEVTVMVYEGGPDKPEYWCKRPALAMVPDTVIVSQTTASILWRAKFADTTHPIADIRQFTLSEVPS